MHKNYQSKGIYGDLIFKILNDVYDEYKKDYFIKTYSNEKITNYYLSKGFRLLDEFRGRSILSFKIKKWNY